MTHHKSSEVEWWNSRKEFLRSPEFHSLLCERTGFLFDVGFIGAIRQFGRAGYPPEGAPTDFLDLDAILAEIPDSQFKD